MTLTLADLKKGDGPPVPRHDQPDGEELREIEAQTTGDGLLYEADKITDFEIDNLPEDPQPFDEDNSEAADAEFLRFMLQG